MFTDEFSALSIVLGTQAFSTQFWKERKKGQRAPRKREREEERNVL